jgi:hypothetical protein
MQKQGTGLIKLKIATSFWAKKGVCHKFKYAVASSW